MKATLARQQATSDISLQELLVAENKALRTEIAANADVIGALQDSCNATAQELLNVRVTLRRLTRELEQARAAPKPLTDPATLPPDQAGAALQ